MSPPLQHAPLDSLDIMQFATLPVPMALAPKEPTAPETAQLAAIHTTEYAIVPVQPLTTPPTHVLTHAPPEQSSTTEHASALPTSASQDSTTTPSQAHALSAAILAPNAPSPTTTAQHVHQV